MKEINSALVQFKKNCPEINLDAEVKMKGKTKDGNQYEIGFKYASLPNILKTTKEPLTNAGLVVYHLVDNEGVTCVLAHESGQEIKSNPFKLNAGSTPKDQGSAITYARRYTMCAILGISAEDDTDAPNNNSGKKPISPTAFDKAVERILNGDPNVFIQVLMHFELTQEQMEQLYELSLQKFSK